MWEPKCFMFYSELKIPRGTHCCWEMEPSSIEELIDSHRCDHFDLDISGDTLIVAKLSTQSLQSYQINFGEE